MGKILRKKKIFSAIFLISLVSGVTLFYFKDSIPIKIPFFTSSASTQKFYRRILNRPPVYLSQIPRELTNDNNHFAWNFYQSAVKEKQRITPENAFYSPFSIYSSLLLAYAGAKENTKLQMETVLGASINSPEVYRNYRYLITYMIKNSVKAKFHFFNSNGIWLQDGFPVYSSYLEKVTILDEESLFKADFEENPEDAVKDINDWVSKGTNGVIPRLLETSDINPDIKLVLVNAIYLKSKWADQFSPEDTTLETFTVISRTHKDLDKKVQMMKLENKHLNFFSNDVVQILEMKYGEEPKNFSMVVLLPRKKDGIFQLEESINFEILSSWLNSLQSVETIVWFPRFEIELSEQLQFILQQMGLTDIFSESMADLSGLSPQTPLNIDKIIHKAFIKVNEEGTEAAAATASTVKHTSSSLSLPQIRIFKADHPFIFLIRERTSGTILFIGRVMDPSPA